MTLNVSQKDTTGDGTTVRPECKGASLRAAALRRDQIPYGVPAIVSSAYSFLGKTGNNIDDRKLFDLLLMGCNRTLLDRVKQSAKFNGTLLDYNQGHYRLVDLAVRHHGKAGTGQCKQRSDFLQPACRHGQRAAGGLEAP